ncbi:MAG: response regulator [Nitrospira sp.]|jgi:two-component system response regulator|nr:response regulator [Nitrospira sp. BO4]
MIVPEDISVLLVEDNEDDVELTIRVFQQYHLANHIHVVRDGAEALDCLFKKGAYAERNVCAQTRLILLDLKLPKVDGLEVLRRCKSEERTKSIPVVVLTSSREEQDVIESYKLGVNSYIVKPVDFHQFVEAVRQLNLYWLVLNQGPA